MKPAQSSLSFANLILAVVLMGLLVGCSQKPLYTNLDEKDANEMIAIMDRKGISSSKTPGEEGKFNITVDQGHFADAVELLKNNGWPRDHFQQMGDVFKKSGLVSSPTEEHIRFIHALSESISETLTHIDGVVKARVHIVLPNNDPFSEKILPSSAAVFIKYRPNADVESAIPQIKNLVINSIEGLSYDKVSVALFPSDEGSVHDWPDRPVKIFSILVSRESLVRFWVLVSIGAVLLVGSLGCSAWLVYDKLKDKQPSPSKK